MNARAIVLVLLAIVVLACGGGGTAWTRSAMVDAMAFSGEESPLADGTPRWLGTGPESAILDIVGPASDPSHVTLTVAASSAAGEMLVKLLDRWAPDARDFVRETIRDSATVDHDTERRFGDRRVRVQTLALSDGIIFTVTIAE